MSRLQCEKEGGSFERRRFDPYFSTVALDDFLDEGEAYARAVGLGAMIVKPLEDAEHFLVEFRGNARSVIAHVKNLTSRRPIWSALSRERADLDDFIVLVVILDRVRYEVAEEFADAWGVTYDCGERFWNNDAGAILVQKMVERAFYIADDARKVGCVYGELLAT